MSFLDPPKERLNPELFEADMTFRPDRFDELKEYLFRMMPEHQIDNLFLLGSNAGYQYSDKSDVDVMVMLTPDADRDALHTKKKKIPVTYLVGTEHEVTFFFQKYIPELNFEDAAYAVYDLSNDRFLVPPSKALYDPKEKFSQQIWFASKIITSIINLAKEYENDKKDLQKLKRKTPAYQAKLRELRDDAEKLAGWFRKLDRDRKTAYWGGFGIPRESQQNITYKMFEYSKYHSLIKKLEEEFGEEVTNLL